MPSARLAVASCLLLGVGATLLLSQLRWFARPPLAERLRPYVPGGLAGGGRSGLLSVESFRDVAAPLARAVGERVARLLGVSEELGRRLERIHSPLDVTAFRLRQVSWALVGFGVGLLAAIALRPPLALVVLLVAGSPALAFLVLEQQVAQASERWQRRVFLELPIVTEQLATLLSAGYSLGGAISRIADRSHGACARDLRRVRARIRQGLSEADALREWAELAQVPALSKLVPVLALNREASDLGRLLAEEARGIRREAHRSLIQLIERRSQQVWIPVTVAALVPGTIFLAVPFVEALRLYSGS